MVRKWEMSAIIDDATCPLSMETRSLLLGLFLGVELDQIVDPQNGDSSLSGETQALDLADSRLHDTSFQIVANTALQQIQARKTQFGLRYVALRCVVVRTQTRHQFRGVLGSIDCQGLRNDQQRVGKLSNGQLLSRSQRRGKVFEVDR